MAATSSRLGIDHVTVVPTNLSRDDAEDPEADAAAEDIGAADTGDPAADDAESPAADPVDR